MPKAFVAFRIRQALQSCNRLRHERMRKRLRWSLCKQEFGLNVVFKLAFVLKTEVDQQAAHVPLNRPVCR